MQLRSALLAATVLAMPFAAQAQPINGLYIGANAGVNILSNQDINSIAGVVTPNLKLDTNLGAVGLLAVGWGFGNGLRTELEFDYRYNPYNKITGPGGVAGTVHGSENKYGPMVNIAYDFTTLSPSFVPYIGAGVGYQWANEHANGIGGFSQTAGAFAYQAILGVGIPIAPVPGLSFTTEYRFMGLAGSRTYGGGALQTKFGTQYNNSVLIGLRYAFGVAPPAPAPMVAPAPAAARSYLVFFDWDKATLTDRARQIIHEAADNSTKVQYTRIEVNGYTDTSGTPTYNQGLSVRRAQAVAAELVKDGVPKNAISIQGFGETHLLVPTGQGVREPQNRRVEIIIR